MLKKLRNKIESKRNSKDLFWKILVLLKDAAFYSFFSWKYLFPLEEYNNSHWLKRFLDYCKRAVLLPVELILYKSNRQGKISLKIIVCHMDLKYEDTKDYFKRFCKSDYEWDNLVLTNEFFADYYIIINNPGSPWNNKFLFYNPKRTIIFQADPIEYRKEWGKWAEPAKKNFFYVYDTKHHHNFVEWQISKDYNWLSNNSIKKTKSLSTVTSALYRFPGHKKRLDFLQFVDKKLKIDIYGRPKMNRWSIAEKLNKLKNYKGSLPHLCKDNGLFPYKYTFAAENSSEKNYFTEKIIDAILSECLCFYWGCPNIEKFINKRAFIRIDLDNPEKALKTIQNAIKNKEWEKRIDIIRKEKKKILNEMQIMPTIERIIKQKLKNKSRDIQL